VISHRVGQEVVFNERFIDLAGLYGFTPRACRPYRARTKGKCERMVSYIKDNFFVRYRSFESWAHLNQLAEQWLREEADQRLHGTVKEVVAERFAREQLSLQPLPTAVFDTSYIEHRQVYWDGYVDICGNRYSVPTAVTGQTVLVRRSLEGDLRLYHNEQLIAQHRLKPATEGWSTIAEHHHELWQSTLQVEQRPLAVYEELLP
ncbi:MAG: transposase, partial [Anaerolineales bacterium]|nr:transposase [Anaerolineales bacterium]